MPYLNNHFHIYDHQADIPIQIVGKENFISWLNFQNTYCRDKDEFARYTFFTTYNKLNEYAKLRTLQRERKGENK
tara:strand:- start:395 stop:619 length:225 start_codon:yes stop_codon:yes gene_type:complete